MILENNEPQNKTITDKLIMIAAFVLILTIAACDQIDGISNKSDHIKMIPVERSASEQITPLVVLVAGENTYKIDGEFFSDENIIDHVSGLHKENPDISIILLGDSSRNQDVEKLSEQLLSDGFHATMVISSK
ncbi:MAG: hypothetical protein JKY46_02330 [Robiginitomaculum sp.]|nr:hypothetical protein [Robiginitomaculum sp.]